VAPKTHNLYGKIVISKKAIRQVILTTAADCYGIASVRSAKMSHENNRIEVAVSLFLKFGVTIDPVIESVRRAVRYNVETFSGMTVEYVNINVLGIRN